MSHSEALYQVYTSFDRSAGINDTLEKFITLQKYNTNQDITAAFDLILTNPSCTDTFGNQYKPAEHTVFITSATPMEKSWIGTSYLNAYTALNNKSLNTTAGAMIAFNPKLSIGIKVLPNTTQAVPLQIAISTKIYIETRGSKMYQQ